MFTREDINQIININMSDFKEDILILNDYIADNPETGGNETKAVAKYIDVLNKYGFGVEHPFSGIETAFKTTINPGRDTKIALLCEYDALPEVGHACGHCASGAISLWAFLALSKISEKLEMQIDLIGTPDEEYTGSKCVMAKQGVFDGYDFAAMCHMGPVNTLDVDFIALRGMTITYEGKATHAAQAPERGINALNAARLFFDAIDMMRQHVIPEARLHGYIANGGAASNIVPAHTEIEFLVRAPKKKDMEEISEWVYDCAKAAALATKAKVRIEPLGNDYYDYSSGEVKLDVMRKSFENAGVKLVSSKGNFVGSSDIGNVDYCCTAFHPVIGISKPDVIIHNKEFSDEMKKANTHEAIENGAKVLLEIVNTVYSDPSKLSALKDEFTKTRK